MTFLEAQKAIAALKSGSPLRFLLGMSGTANPLDLFLRGHAAKRGFVAEPHYLSFGTLAQSAISLPPEADEIWIVFPWDLVPECDWRSGLTDEAAPIPALLDRAESLVTSLAKRKAKVLYVPASLPPMFLDGAKNVQLAAELEAMAVRHGARLFETESFSLATYFASGCPFGGTGLSGVAEQLIDLLLSPPATAKVLVTDLDETLWSGLVGEDGAENVKAEPEGKGFPHFVYQTMLRKLKKAGVLLAVVSRNDPKVAQQPLAGNSMVLGTGDFVAIKAGYGSKSDHIAALAADLNLGLDAFVFVDDNPVELAEVNSRLPAVTCVPFPKREQELPHLLDRLAALFGRHEVTAEDAERTELYRRRMASLPPPSGDGDRLKEFLVDLKMALTIRRRTKDDCQRAFQLINKTNQFNLNGIRLEKEQVDSVLDQGGCLLTASLEDRTGSHGEILACLLDAGGQIVSWVMSCRVFQRRVEFAFLAWLAGNWPGPALTLVFAATDKNEPTRNFVSDPAIGAAVDGSPVDRAAFIAAHADDMELFSLHAESIFN